MQVPLAWVVLLTLLFAIPFSRIPWPYGDVYTVLSKAAELDWRNAFLDAFARDVEYRPFFTLLVKALYDVAGLSLWFYKLIVLVQYAAILSVFLLILRPDSHRRMVAAFIALACIVGLHTTRILFSFFPVNHHSLTMLLVLAAAAIALRERTRWTELLLAVLTLSALFLIEFGILIPFMLTALHVARAPGATRRAVRGAWIAFVLYGALRVLFGTQTEFPIAHAETGLGFTIVERDDLNRIFANAPWLFWAHNVMAALLTVLFSEPRTGTWIFVSSLLRGTTAPRAWLRPHSGWAS